MAVAKSLSRFRFAEPSSFRLDAIAGELLVIAPMQSRATYSAFSNPDFRHRIYTRVVAVYLQQCAGDELHIDAVTCREQLVSTAISGKFASGISTAPMIQLCLHYRWFDRDQRYVNANLRPPCPP